MYGICRTHSRPASAFEASLSPFMRPNVTRWNDMFFFLNTVASRFERVEIGLPKGVRTIVRVQLDRYKSRGGEITKQRTPSPFGYEAIYARANRRSRNTIASKVSPA
jgi:hypothetical protein